MYHTNGVNPYKWYPTTAGRNYVMPENLALLKDLKDDMTVFSGLAHFRAPQSAGHWGLSNLLTGCGNGGGVKFHTSVSLDQYLAPHIGKGTRIQSLNLSCKTGVGALNERIVTISFSQRGNPLPTESSPPAVAKVTMLRVQGDLAVEQQGAGLKVTLPSILEGEHAWTLKIEG